MGIENGGSGGGPPLARRPFKLATAAPPTMLLRNLAIAASVALLVATLVVVIPSTGMSGVVGSASHYLTTASLYVSSASAQLNSLAAGAATNGSSAEGGATPGADGGSSSGDAGADAEGGGGETPDEAAEGDGGDGGGVDGEGVDPDLPCRESGYCSVGKLQAYVGEVDSTEGFKAMVRWRGAVVAGGGGEAGEAGPWPNAVPLEGSRVLHACMPLACCLFAPLCTEAAQLRCHLLQAGVPCLHA